MIEGVIFDMDGVLVDSEPFIREAAVLLFSEHGVTVREESFMAFTGMGENRFIGGVAEQVGLSLEIEAAKRRLYELYGEVIQGRLGPLDGTLDFLETCSARGLKIAVATSADLTKLEQNLTAIQIPPQRFNAVVTGSDIEHKKPAPDLFLEAARQIGLPPQACLVVEDAPAGIVAGKAAGCKTLALTTSFTKKKLEGADWFASTFVDAPAECLNW